MKILISNDGYTAFYYIRLGLLRAFEACGHKVKLWDINQQPVFDAFDEFEPDLFLGQTYNTTETLFRAIKERPHMKVIMKAADAGDFYKDVDLDYYGILTAQQEELDRIVRLYRESGKPDFLHIYYHPDYIDKTHQYWIDAGIPVKSILLASDVYDYTRGKKVPEFESDICFIGGYWPYKADVLNPYLINLCYDTDYKIKIFGNSHWPVVQYCGSIENNMTKHVTASATICPCLHEPHAGKFGFDISERIYKLLSNKCFVISNYVEGIDKLFNDSIVLVDDPESFKEKVKYFIENPEKRQPYIDNGYNKVINNHTYFDRVIQIFDTLGIYEDRDRAQYTKQMVLKQL
jgi:hypothetical protein